MRKAPIVSSRRTTVLRPTCDPLRLARCFVRLFAVLTLLFVQMIGARTANAQAAPRKSAKDHPAAASAEKPHYVGSEACRTCHQKAYNGWKKSRMANILLDPKVHPEAVIGDFSHPDPVRTFTLDDVAFTYAAASSSAISPSAATITTHSPRSGTLPTNVGYPITSKREPIGGRRSTVRRTSIAPPAPPAMDATRSTTTSKRIR